MSDPAHTPARQPLVHDGQVVVAAPTQVWSDDAGDAGDDSLSGLYHSDLRVFDRVRLTVDGHTPERISTRAGGDELAVVSLLRHLDGDGADPRVRLERDRRVRPGRVDEQITITSGRPVAVTTCVQVSLRGEFATLAAVKSGSATTEDERPQCRVDGARARWEYGTAEATINAPEAVLIADGPTLALRWEVTVPAHGAVSVDWSADVHDGAAVVQPADTAAGWEGASVHTGDIRLQRWVEASLRDLRGLRVATIREPDEPFLAAGAPWFFTLFGRDAIWAAQFLLPINPELAASTLRVLAAFQGSKTDPATAEQPGKIMHELRPAELAIPGEGVTLPPLYYGTIDATCLWICLLHDAWRWGMPDAQVRALLPNLEAALRWMDEYGDADGDGFLEYIDQTGTGLANQGWKDSGDSVQWHDGRLAEAPIALCEVQGYAYEAAMGAAEILDAFTRPGGQRWRAWAQRLKERFAQRFWVTEPADGGVPYPAIALDAQKRPVDSLTSNIGHLLGTGILDPDQREQVITRLTSASMDSGFGLRTMSTNDAGYWPLSYHGGSVWTHDTAVVIRGMAREGRGQAALGLIEGLLAAAEGFGYRMPELHSGDAALPGEIAAGPVPYPAACRPQAWSAAASIAVLSAVLGIAPDGDGLGGAPMEPSPVGAVRVRGVRVGSGCFDVSVDNAGMSIRRSAHDRLA